MPSSSIIHSKIIRNTLLIIIIIIQFTFFIRIYTVRHILFIQLLCTISMHISINYRNYIPIHRSTQKTQTHKTQNKKHKTKNTKQKTQTHFANFNTLAKFINSKTTKNIVLSGVYVIHISIIFTNIADFFII